MTKLKLRLQDGREFPISERIANSLREAKAVEKATDFFTLTHPEKGYVLYEGEYRSIKEIVHEQPATVDIGHGKETERLENNKKKREEWTDKFLEENDYDGSIMEQYLDAAAEKMKSALNRQWVGNKFITQMARVMIREKNGCPFP